MKRRVKIAAIVLGALVGFVVLLALVGYALPSELHLTPISATLDASGDELFSYFDNRAGQQRLWTQAARNSGPGGFPPMEIVDLGGPDSGVGARLGFFPSRKSAGSLGGVVSSVVRGKGVIVESEQARKIVYEIDFGMVVARRTIDFEALGDDTTRVSWSETLLTPNPLMRYGLLMVDPSMGENFNIVLEALAVVVEEDRGTVR